VAIGRMLFVLLLSGSVAGLTCDDTPGVTMTARHYNYDLEQVPASIMHCDRLTLRLASATPNQATLHVHAAQ
jgi:hypothetical protein